MTREGFDLDLVAFRGFFDVGGHKAAVSPLPESFARVATDFQRVRRVTGESLLRITLLSGDEIEVELEDSVENGTTLRAGRSVVYLDQNQWSKVAAWRYRHRKVAAEEGKACAALVDLVERGAVVLPASAANLVETGPLFGERRTDHAAALLEFSRGWQMRNPLHVRVEEMTRALAGTSPQAADVFTPNADVSFNGLSEDARGSGGIPTGFTPEIQRILALYGTMLEPDAIPDEGGEAAAKAQKWADLFQAISRQLHADGADRIQTWTVVHEALASDLVVDLAKACRNVHADTKAAESRLMADDTFLGDLPFLGRLRHLLFSRVRNVGQRWRKNDLIDCHSLACAAGYADHVVAEKATIGYLRQNPAHHRAPPTLSTSLVECTTALRAAPDTNETGGTCRVNIPG